jgi:predicted transcriptional regulator
MAVAETALCPAVPAIQIGVDITIYMAYGCHMSLTEKTTVYLDSADYRRLKALAEAESRPAAELIREAVSEYVRRRAPRSAPASVGVGRSGSGVLAERAEALLEGLGEDS